ncbi:MAG: dihydrodipicolinate synthase family protein [Acidimicrobiia bacterium]
MPGAVFEGVGVALLTFFDDSGALDADACAGHAARLVDAGVRAVVVAGTTGEAAMLTAAERVELLEAVRAGVSGVPVIAGSGAPSIRGAVELTGDALEHGADAVLVLSPPEAGDTVPYYEAVVEAAGDVPVLAYHYPEVSPPGITLDDLVRLPVAGCKDSTGDPERLLEELEAWDRPVYTGSSAMLSFAGPMGATGAILGLANLEPGLCARAFTGDMQAQRDLVGAHLASRERFPAALKEAVGAAYGTPVSTRAAV